MFEQIWYYPSDETQMRDRKMTKRKNVEEFSESLDGRRHKADDKWLRRMDARDQDIKTLGQLCRNGATIYYSFAVGGKYLESANPYDLV
jgi:hypothetical protein